MNFEGYKKYIFTFIITAAIFFVAFSMSNYSNQKRIQNIESIEDKIALDLLSSETQFNLFKEFSCKGVDNPVLSSELNSIAEKLAYAEQNLGTANPEVIRLKKYYSVLEVKDYLLMQQMDQKCNQKPLFILYFYSNQGDCIDCIKQGYVLTDLRNEYPELRVYSFDYNLDYSIIKTLRSFFKIENTLPAMVIGDNTHYGFKSREDIEKLIPELAKLKAEHEKAQMATSTMATTTKKK
jgi:hypothetical protein